ncbi:MAG: folylpolyglutamate synthase/dihydrofolate synthase family protein [Planctomycetota bacterium]
MSLMNRTPPTTQLTEIKPVSSFAQAVSVLERLPNLETQRPEHIGEDSFKLARMHALLERLDDPHRELTLVHVAGSKGKGSVCEMLAAALTGCGYAVGVHTSPHLVDVRERIRIGTDLVSESAFVTLLNRTLRAAASIEQTLGPASYFEIIAAMALSHFRDQAVDVGVIEVGLGGRLDATNVITPAVALIGAIQLEHTQILGTTPAAIAAEKAGIIKPGVPTITIPQDDETALEVIERAAERAGSPLGVIGREIEFTQRFEADPELGPHMRIGITTDRTAFEHIAVPLPGEHQARNCALALAAIDVLVGRGIDAPEVRVAAGLADTGRRGRLETVWDQPRVIADGAHSPDSIASLVRTIGAHVRYDSMAVVFGCAADKDTDGMLAEIARGADKIIMTRSASNPRTADPAHLAERYEAISGKTAQIAESVKEAVNIAARAIGHNDLICVTGSFYIAGEAKKLFEDKAAAPQSA